MDILLITDFQNYIPLNSSNTDEFKVIANKTIYKSLNCLLGSYLHHELINDLDSELRQPQTQKYIDLVDGVYYKDTSGQSVNYLGLRTMLINFVVYEWLKYIRDKNTLIGVVSPAIDNNQLSNTALFKSRIANYWNEAIMDYNFVVKFLSDKYLSGESYFGDEFAFWQPEMKLPIMKVGFISQLTNNHGHI